MFEKAGAGNYGWCYNRWRVKWDGKWRLWEFYSWMIYWWHLVRVLMPEFSVRFYFKISWRLRRLDSSWSNQASILRRGIIIWAHSKSKIPLRWLRIWIKTTNRAETWSKYVLRRGSVTLTLRVRSVRPNWWRRQRRKEVRNPEFQWNHHKVCFWWWKNFQRKWRHLFLLITLEWRSVIPSNNEIRKI